MNHLTMEGASSTFSFRPQNWSLLGQDCSHRAGRFQPSAQYSYFEKISRSLGSVAKFLLSSTKLRLGLNNSVFPITCFFPTRFLRCRWVYVMTQHGWRPATSENLVCAVLWQAWWAVAGDITLEWSLQPNFCSFWRRVAISRSVSATQTPGELEMLFQKQGRPNWWDWVWLCAPLTCLLAALPYLYNMGWEQGRRGWTHR